MRFFFALLLCCLPAFGQQQMVKSVDTITHLKRANVYDLHKTIQVLGGSAKGDGDGGLYYWDASSAAAADDEDVVASEVSATGRWLRVVDYTGGGATLSDGDKGDITLSDSGETWLIDPNSVALGTDTTGNFIATIAGTTGQITVSGSGSENAAVTLSLPAQVDLSTNTFFRIPNNNTPSGVLSGAGSMVYDQNAIDVDTGAIVVYDQNSGRMVVVAIPDSDTPTSGQIPKYNGTTITWEDDDNDAAGADNVSVNGTAATNANFVVGAHIDFELSGASYDTINAFIRDNAVTFDLIEEISAASRLLGRGSASAGDVQEISLGAGLTMTGTTLSMEGTRVGVIRRIWVDAKDMLPVGAATNVNYIPSTTTDGMNATVIAFDGGSTERAQFRRKLDHWDGDSTNVTVQLVVAASSTGASVWQVEVGSITAGGSFGNILGSASTSVTKTSTAADVMSEVKISDFTIGNTPAATDLLYFRITRLGGDGSDTSSSDEYLLGAWVEYVETETEQTAL